MFVPANSASVSTVSAGWLLDNHMPQGFATGQVWQDTLWGKCDYSLCDAYDLNDRLGCFCDNLVRFCLGQTEGRRETDDVALRHRPPDDPA